MEVFAVIASAFGMWEDFAANPWTILITVALVVPLIGGSVLGVAMAPARLKKTTTPEP